MVQEILGGMGTMPAQEPMEPMDILHMDMAKMVMEIRAITTEVGAPVVLDSMEMEVPQIQAPEPYPSKMEA